MNNDSSSNTVTTSDQWYQTDTQPGCGLPVPDRVDLNWDITGGSGNQSEPGILPVTDRATRCIVGFTELTLTGQPVKLVLTEKIEKSQK